MRWKSPPADVSVKDLFPKELMGFDLVEVNTRADIKDLNIHVPGQHAIYRAQDVDADVFAYHITELEKEAIFHRVEECIWDAKNDSLDKSSGDLGFRSQYGAIERWSVSLDPFAGDGEFWWDGQWLFFVRSESYTKNFMLTYIEQLEVAIKRAPDKQSVLEKVGSP